MSFNSLKNFCVFLFLLFSLALKAQDIKSVDPKSLPESDIKKVEQAIHDAGLNFNEAAELARQRGASEQQIKDMQQRLQRSQEGTDIDADLSEGESPAEKLTEPEEPEDDLESTDLSSAQRSGRDVNRIFGAYLFNSRNLTFEPRLNIQTPKNYEIGIDDQIIINIWGNSQNTYQLTVNSNGQIMIPDVGPVYVAGLTFSAAETKIKQRLTEIYADMSQPDPKTFAQINMGRLRSIRVNLLGEVVTPGTYTLPVTATLFNALYLSGGPNSIGSFRNIHVIRNNKIFNTIDIYRFLLDADVSENIQLKDEDIILVPPAEKKVQITGEFKRIGFFEMADNEKLNELIRFAGGFTGDAYWSNLKIYRKTLEGRIILDVPFEDATSTALYNGDVITNGKIYESFKNRVSISGAIMRPGDYEWKEGMTLIDLILKADSLRGDAFANRGLIIRLNEDSTTTNISFDLASIVQREDSILLNPEDQVLIKSHFNLKQNPFISVSGEILNPGQYNYSEGITLADAIFMAGGFTEAADSSIIEVARRLSYEEASQLSDELVHVYTLNLSRDLKQNINDANFILKPFDRVSVRRAPGYRESASAVVLGEIKYAGQYAIQNKNQRISDLIEMAGGLTSQSFPAGATLTRTSEELGEELVAINMNKIITNPNGKNDLYLLDGDVINIPQFIQTVKITGQVQNPFSITYEEGKPLKYYIDKCGGFSQDALKRKVFVRFPNGETASTKSFVVKNYPEVLPGSQIVVPAKPEKEPINTGTWLSIASTFSSIAIAIAAIMR
jgi:protein involved in polysaccharide export with SLBB domain